MACPTRTEDLASKLSFDLTPGVSPGAAEPKGCSALPQGPYTSGTVGACGSVWLLRFLPGPLPFLGGPLSAAPWEEGCVLGRVCLLRTFV